MLRYIDNVRYLLKQKLDINPKKMILNLFHMDYHDCMLDRRDSFKILTLIIKNTKLQIDEEFFKEVKKILQNVDCRDSEEIFIEMLESYLN